MIFLNKSNLLLFIYAGATFSPVLILGGLWGNPFLIEKFQITNISASMFLFVMFIGIGIGAPIWAIMAANVQRRKNLMHTANFISVLSLIGIIYFNLPYNATIILFFILGLATGCLMLYFQLCRETNSIYLLGMAIAFVNTSDGVFVSALETLIGYILDVLKNQGGFSIASYKIALSILPLCFIVSSLSLLYLNIQNNINEKSKVILI